MTRTTTSNRGRAPAAAALLALAAVASAMLAGRATAQGAAYDFDATAGAYGVRVTATIEGFLFVPQIVDLSGTTAQATIDSLGTSEAFAAYPYPGSTVGANPSYPLVVRSSAPSQPESTLDHGVYALTASSEADHSAARARGGVATDGGGTGATDATARVTHEPDARRVTSQATTTTEAVGFADVLRLGRVHSLARVTASPDGEPEAATDLVVEGMTVAGQSVGITADGLVLAGEATPLPEDDPLQQALADSGISLRYLAPAGNDSGVVAPGIEVTVRRDIPETGPGVVTYVFGRAAASVDVRDRPGTADPVEPDQAGADPAAGDPGGGGSADGTATPGTGSSSAAPPVARSAPGQAPGATAGGATTRSSPPARPSAPAPTVAPSQPPAPAQAAQQELAASTPGFSSASFYVMLAVAAIAALGGLQLIRLVGVRKTWMS